MTVTVTVAVTVSVQFGAVPAGSQGQPWACTHSSVPEFMAGRVSAVASAETELCRN